jgi:acyl-CoA synthetase (NDP forming)
MIVFAHAGEETDTYCRAFTQAGVAAFPSLARTIRAARILVERAVLVGVAARAGETAVNPVHTGTSTAGRWLAELGDNALPTEADTKALLDAYGLETPRRLVVEYGGSGAGASLPVPEFPGPYAVKVASAEVLHKTEAGALRLNVTEWDLRTVLGELWAAFPGSALLVEEMVGNVEVELIAGATVDSDLGPALMLGAGGILTELYRDVSFRLLPARREDIAAMTDELTISPLLAGFRGIHADRSKLVDTLSTIGELVADLGEWFGELDVNPLCYAAGRWIVLDAKLVRKGNKRRANG